MKNMMLAPKQFDQVNRDLEIRDLYNMEDAFQPRRGLPGRIPGAPQRQPRLLGRSRRQGRLADRRRRHASADRAGSRRLPRRRPGKPYAEQGSFLEIELAARDGRAHQTCGGRALNDDVMDTIFTLLINAGNGPMIRDGVDRSTSPARTASRTWRRRIRIRPSSPSTTTDADAGDAPIAADGRRAWSSTTSRAARCTSDLRRMWAATCCSGSTTGRRDASWCGACTRSSIPAGRRRIPSTTRGSRSLSPITVSRRSAFRRIPSTASRRSSGWGWRRVRPSSGTSARAPGAVGAAARDGRGACRDGGPLTRCAAAGGARRAGSERPRRAARRRGDLASGLLPAADRPHLVRLQGRDRPALGRRERDPPSNPRERPLKAGEIILGYPDETGELPPMPTPEVLGRNGTYVVFRKLHTRVAAYRRYLRERAASREEEELLGAKMVGRWQSGAPLALSPGTGRSRARRRP